jgi:hypothetical protein
VVMKTILMGLLLLACGSTAFAQNVSIKNLVGQWQSADGAGLEIIDSSRIFVTYGKERKPILSYQADFTRSPYWFDFVVKDTAQKLSTIKSLLLLQGNDVLKWEVFEDGNRPSDFIADKGEIVILRRKK